MDSQRQLQLSTDWAEDSSSSLPSWLQPLAPRSPGRPGLPASLCPPVLTCRQGRLWEASPLSSSLRLAPASLHCYTWSSLPQLSSPQARLARLWAGEREAYSGRLLLSPSPACLLWTQIHSGRLEALALPRGERLGQVAVLPQALWLLAESGRVYIRSVPGGRSLYQSWVAAACISPEWPQPVDWVQEQPDGGGLGCPCPGTADWTHPLLHLSGQGPGGTRRYRSAPGMKLYRRFIDHDIFTVHKF